METPAMKKTGKLLLYPFLIFFTLLATNHILAQNVEVNASLSETNIFSGEQVSLNVNVTGSSLNSMDDPVLPEIKGLRIVPNAVSRSTNYTIINGRPSVTLSRGYTMIAQDVGEYVIPPIEVSINNETYRTDPIPFKILDPASIDRGEAERSPDLFLRIEPDIENPYVGQQVIADVVLYFKQGLEVSSYQAMPGWKAEGFWKEDLKNPQRAQTSSTLINGVRYQRARLLQYAIFPTKQGELTLSPFEVSVNVRDRGRSRDPFSFGLGTERVSLESIPVTINVERVPRIEEAVFAGAVGDFNIDREASITDVLVGESVEIITTIRGAGNVPLINKPEYEITSGLERYNPQESSNISNSNRQIRGVKTFTDIVIPRSEGTFTIPEVKVSYFDPVAKRHNVKTLRAITLNVKRDANAVLTSSNNQRFDVKPVTGLSIWYSTSSRPLYKSVWVWILMAIPLLLTGLVYAYKQYQHKMMHDADFVRSKKAYEKAKKLLDEATNATDIKESYRLIEKALFGFIADKMRLPVAGMSNNELIANLSEKAPTELISELKRLFNKSETVAYAPNITQKGLENDLTKAKDLINKLRNVL